MVTTPQSLPDLLARGLQGRRGLHSSLLLLGDGIVPDVLTQADPAWTVTVGELKLGARAEVTFPGSTAAFDVVICLDGVSNWDFPWFVVQELARSLLPGGILVLGDSGSSGRYRPDIEGLKALTRWADLRPSDVDADLNVVCAVKPSRRSIRRSLGSLRQRRLRAISRTHARRRVEATQPNASVREEVLAGPSLPEVDHHLGQAQPSVTVQPASPAQPSVSGQTGRLASAPPAAVVLHRAEVLERLTSLGVVTFGAGSYGVPEILSYEGDDSQVRIGSWSSIADDVVIMLGGNHRLDKASTYPFRGRLGLPGAFQDGYPSGKGDVLIGSDVWIGRGAMIMSGSVIGDGAVIGAGAVVAGAVRPYAIVVGNPGKEIRRRFDDVTVTQLCSLRWWDWPEEELRQIVPLLNDAPIDELISYAKQRIS